MPDGTFVVELRDLPIAVHRRASAHMEALQREFELMRQDPTADRDVPDRLRALIDDLTQRFGGLNDGPNAEIQAAEDRGEASLHLRMELPFEAVPAARALDEMLDDADDFCRRGEHLLTLAMPDELLAYRRWYLGEVSRQAAGEPPLSWTDCRAPSAAADGATDADAAVTAATPEWTVTVEDVARVTLSGALDLESAPQLRSLLATIANKGPGQVVLDLTDVDFVDSVGLSVIISSHSRIVQAGGALRVIAPDQIRRTFEISGVDELLGIA